MFYTDMTNLITLQEITPGTMIAAQFAPVVNSVLALAVNAWIAPRIEILESMFKAFKNDWLNHGLLNDYNKKIALMIFSLNWNYYLAHLYFVFKIMWLWCGWSRVFGVWNLQSMCQESGFKFWFFKSQWRCQVSRLLLLQINSVI